MFKSLSLLTGICEGLAQALTDTVKEALALALGSFSQHKCLLYVTTAPSPCPRLHNSRGTDSLMLEKKTKKTPKQHWHFLTDSV